MYKKIEKLMNEKGITAYRVSKDTGISKSCLRDWKKGISSPKFDKIKILADYFKVPIEYFVED